VRERGTGSSNKKAVVQLLDRTALKGYVNPAGLGESPMIDVLTPEGEHLAVEMKSVRTIYFVRELEGVFQLQRKSFLSRPKLDGLWVRVRFADEDVIEGLITNDLIDLLDSGIQLTPPDLHGNTVRLFIPRTAIEEMKVLGVVGIARRSTPDARAVTGAQTKLFAD